MKEKTISGIKIKKEFLETRQSLSYYDLDGTLSNLNSTFDFIHDYLLSRKRYLRLFIASNILRLLVVSRTYNPYNHRRFVILAYFRGLKKQDLESFYETNYKQKFLRSLTLLGQELNQNPAGADVLLTGCTEIPAKQIASMFCFKTVIATEFLYKNNRISGIKTDTYGCNKRNFVTKNDKVKTVYYTDDLNSEKSLLELMDKIIEV